VQITGKTMPGTEQRTAAAMCGRFVFAVGLQESIEVQERGRHL